MASVVSAVMAMVLDIDRVDTYVVGETGHITFTTTTFTDPIGEKLMPVKMFLFNLIDTPMKIAKITSKEKIYDGIIFDQYYVDCEVPSARLGKAEENVRRAREALRLQGSRGMMSGESLISRIRR